MMTMPVTIRAHFSTRVTAVNTRPIERALTAMMTAKTKTGSAVPMP
jgi:hypothetical protein